MKRFILNEEPDQHGTIRLTGNDYHYLIRVRRLAIGECFPALLPSGKETLVQIRSLDGGVLTGEVASKAGFKPASEAGSEPGFIPGFKAGSEPASEPGSKAASEAASALPPIILFQALPKGEKMDLIVRQAAEGGLSEVVPFEAEFSIQKITARKTKIDRWERIVKEARQQSGSGIATVVRPPMTAEELFAYWEKLKMAGALGLMFHQIPLENGSLHGYLDKGASMVVLTIGPEGGFSPAETERFLGAGFKPLTIGDTVLRTETAALYGAAAIRTILWEKNSWEMKQNR